MSELDIAQIVAVLREKRKNWAQAEAQGKTKKAKAVPGSQNIELKDLDL